jgi:LysM repeat protein
MFPRNIFKYAVSYCLISYLILTSSLGACSSAPITPVTNQSRPQELTRYYTPTESQTPTNAPTNTPAPTATPTPLIHEVKANDVMGKIALQYGVSIEAIMTANPRIDPAAMSIGAKLIIPAAQKTPDSSNFTPTPQPIAISNPVCYQMPDSGVQCFLLATNNELDAIENASARITLLNSKGEVIKEQIATSPLNFIPAGETLPLTTYFSPPIPINFNVIGELMTAFLVEKNNKRYLPGSTEDLQIAISEDGTRAHLTGKVSFTSENTETNKIWILASAYNKKGEIIGVRKWESDTALSGKDSHPFDMMVYSLGPEIAQVKVLVEAHPQ